MPRRPPRLDLRYVIAALVLWGAGLTACSSPPVASEPVLSLALTHPAGAVRLTRDKIASDLAKSALLLPGDQLSTTSADTATLQLPEGSTLELGPSSRLVLATIRPADGVAVFQLLEGSIDGRLRSGLFEMQGYNEVAKNFRMVVNNLTVILRSSAGAYHLWLDGDRLKAVIKDGEFDVHVGNQQTTLNPGWQVIAEPDEPLQLVSLLTPTSPPEPPTAVPSATLIPIVRLTDTPTPTPSTIPSATTTATSSPTRTPVRQTVIANTPLATPIIETPLPTATEKPDKPPRPTSPPPTAKPPTAPPPTAPPPTAKPPTAPPPTEPPPTAPPPTPRPTVGG